MAEHDHPDALPAGSVLLEYRINAALSADGFGITYFARDSVRQKDVVIREYFPPDLAQRSTDGFVKPIGDETRANYEKGLAQSMAEARTLARIVHPNIVRIDRHFEANGTAYVVRDYEAGESLARLFTRTPHPDEATLKAILRPLLDGLEAVHDADVLHRDIKPGTIFLRDEGSPVLLDFGASRLARQEAIQDITPVLTSGYVPLEQYVRSGRQGPWSDLYSLAAVLYWTVTGEDPPAAVSRTRMDNVAKTLNAARVWYSGPFIEAIHWALTLEEDRRPRNVAEWRSALFREAGSRASPKMASSAEPQATRKYVWIALGIVIFYLFVEGADIVKQREQARAGLQSTFKAPGRPLPSGDAERQAADAGSAGLTREEFAQNLPHLLGNFAEIDADGNGRVTTEELQGYWRRGPAAKTAPVDR
jgi:serine/threonine protein kinase